MNTQHQLIHDYLDGNIEPYMEESLFGQLSANEELRREFAAQMALQKSAAADMRSIVAPDDAKRAVFAQIGLLPVATSADIVATTAATGMGIWAWLSSRVMVVSTIAALSLMVGGTGVWLGYEYGGAGNSASNTQMAQNNVVSVPSSVPTPVPATKKGSELTIAKEMPLNMPSRSFSGVTHNGGVHNQPAAAQAQESAMSNAANIASTDNSDKNTDNTSIEEHQQQTPAISPAAPISSLANNGALTSNSGTISGTIPQVQQNIRNQVVPTFVDNPVMLTVRGASPLSQALLTGKAAFANGALTAFYNVNDNNSIGLEFSNEYYSFSETRPVLGRNEQVEYAEVMPAFGAVYRYSMQGFSFMNVTPFGQAFLGGTTTGNPLGRASLGFEWSPERRIGLLLGIDAAVMPYRMQGVWQTSFKPSLIYGVQVRF